MKSRLILSSILIMGLVTILISGPLAHAVNADDSFHVKAKGKASCIDAIDQSCGVGTAKTKLLFKVTDFQEDSLSGIGEGTLEIKWNKNSLDTSSTSSEFIHQSEPTPSSSDTVNFRMKSDLILDAGNDIRLWPGLNDDDLKMEAKGTATTQNGETFEIIVKIKNLQLKNNGKYSGDLVLSSTSWQKPDHPQTSAVIQMKGFTWSTTSDTLKSKGMFMCETLTGDFCGGGKMKNKLTFDVTETDDKQTSGVSTMKLIIRPDLEDSDTYALISNNLSWTFDKSTNIISMTGITQGDPKSAFKVEINGWFLPDVGDEVFLRTIVTSPTGDTIIGFSAGVQTDILELVGGKDKVEF